MKQLSGFLLFLLIHASAFAQFYPTQHRPPSLNWQELKTPHFKILFPKGEDSVAWRTGRILESEYGEVQGLAGGSLSEFPVVLNNYNDRSNGFVSPLHFRSEIEIPPIKGKALNPQSGNWLEAVEPHELVHALHLSNTGGFGLGGLVNLFSPDLARSLHGAIPSGITEGLATYYETHSVAPNGGRGNHPYFYNQFNAVFNSADPWSMGQLVHYPERTRPFNRHYIGGYEFTAWLQEAYGEETSRDALNFYIDLPFLGYGVALRHATGEWPGELYDAYTQAKKEELTKTNESAGNTTIAPLPIPYKGVSIHRPAWIDKETLLFYGSFYNGRSGFYRYNLNTGSLHREVTTNSVGDYLYDLSQDKSTLLYAYYRSSPVYDNTFKTELVEVNLETGKSSRLTTNGRLYAPIYTDGAIQALQTHHASSRLVSFNKDSKTTELIAGLGKHQIIEMAASPVNPDKRAVIVNKRGMQGLWITGDETIEQDLRQSPAVSFTSGSVYDISWHPQQDKLLLTSDHTGTMQIYEYDLEANRLRQLTESRYNAFEASYSPSGDQISFVVQKENEQLPAILSEEEYYNQRVDPELWKPSPTKEKFMQRPELGHDVNTEGWQQADYSDGLSWLKPRAVLPVVEEVGNTDSYQIGAALHSNNLLQNQSYSLQLTGFEERLWYDFTYRNKMFYPGFRASAFSEPAFRTLGFVTEQDTTTVPLIRQERSFALSVPISYTLDRNIYFSSFTVEPEIRRSQIRYFDTGGGSAASNFGNLTIGNIFSSFNYRLQQNIRDVQPNSGITLFGEAEHYFSTSDLRFSVSGQQFERSFIKPTALRGGLYTYVSPLRKWNQSLRISLLGITQTDAVFDNQFLVSNGFSESVFPLSNNLLSFGTRYTVPLISADDGGFLLPLYLSNIYLAGFSNTVADASGGDPLRHTRTVFGAGIRARFRLSNLSFDIGVAIGYEPTRKSSNVFVGNF